MSPQHDNRTMATTGMLAIRYVQHSTHCFLLIELQTPLNGSVRYYYAEYYRTLEKDACRVTVTKYIMIVLALVNIT